MDRLFDEAGRIGTTLYCIECGYDLRTLGAWAACPECGRSVKATIAGSPLRFASIAWLRRVAGGVRTLAAAAWLYFVVFVILFAFIAASALLPRSRVSDPLESLLVVAAVLFFGTFVLALTGLFLATARLDGRDDDRLTRLADGARGAAMLPFVAVPLAFGCTPVVAALVPLAIAVPWLLVFNYVRDLTAGDAKAGQWRALRITLTLLRTVVIFWGVFPVLVLLAVPLFTSPSPNSGLLVAIGVILATVMAVTHVVLALAAALALQRIQARLRDVLAEARARAAAESPSAGAHGA